MTTCKYYAGIGSRETPTHVQETMTKIAELLERRKYTLRSGGAVGADLAFEKGVVENKEIFYTDSYTVNEKYYNYDQDDLNFADKILKEYHPAYKKHGKGVKNIKAKKLLSRNTFQIFGVGSETINSDFVICYTPDGTESTTTYNTGGTGQAIRIAYDYGIPIYNLKNYIGVSPEEMVEFILNEMRGR